MIEITRSLARRLKMVFRRALGTTAHNLAPAVTLQSGPHGLRVRVRGHRAAVVYRESGDHPPEHITVPFEFLGDCEGRKDDPVQLEAEAKDRIVASWQDGSIPQIAQYQIPININEEFPPLPQKLATNEPRLLETLKQVSECADVEQTRYALGCLQLRSPGEVVGTDGRQLLLARGFDFPWDGNRLIPSSKVWTSRELSRDTPVSIGSSEDWVTISIGSWTFHQRIEKDARFPNVDAVIPDVGQAVATLQLSSADSEFLCRNLSRLPVGQDDHMSVTLDLNGQAVIRAKGEHGPPTELLLRGSQPAGQVVRANSNRQYLERALRMGFREVAYFGNDTALLCWDEHASYLWKPLPEELAIGPSSDAIRIESPLEAQPNEVTSTNSKPKTRNNTMPKTKPSTNGKDNRTKTDESTSSDALVEQAEALRVSLREAQANLGELISGLRRHKRQAKSVHTAIRSLRQLQTLEA